MSLEILGDGFDLHGGGDDLVFPHHENEIAQAEGAGHEFARYWVHAGMVMWRREDGEVARQLPQPRRCTRRTRPRAFRLLALQTHYRRAMEINDDQLRAAAKAVDVSRQPHAPGAYRTTSRVQTRDIPQIPEFVEAMDDDFGTPEAVATVFSLAKEANAAIDAGERGRGRDARRNSAELTNVLGLEIGVEHAVSATRARTWKD